MPMDPANAVRNVRPFLVRKLLKLNANDVLGWFERVGVGTDHTVLELHNARGILVGQFGVMCHHHHEAVFGNLFEQIHDLHGSIGIKRTGRLVGEHDVRIVH